MLWRKLFDDAREVLCGLAFEGSPEAALRARDLRRHWSALPEFRDKRDLFDTIVGDLRLWDASPDKVVLDAFAKPDPFRPNYAEDLPQIILTLARSNESTSLIVRASSKGPVHIQIRTPGMPASFRLERTEIATFVGLLLEAHRLWISPVTLEPKVLKTIRLDDGDELAVSVAKVGDRYVLDCLRRRNRFSKGGVAIRFDELLRLSSTLGELQPKSLPRVGAGPAGRASRFTAAPRRGDF